MAGRWRSSPCSCRGGASTSAPFSASTSGWNTGFTGVLGSLLLVAAGIYIVLRRSEVSMPELPAGPAAVIAGASILGVLLILIRLVTLPDVQGIGAGARFGIFLALIAGVVQVVGAVMAFRESGEALPWAGDKTPGAS